MSKNSSPYIKLEEVRVPLFSKGAEMAALVISKKSGFQEKLGKTSICRFHPKMNGDKINNLILFLDPDKKYVTGGQIGIFSPETGLVCESF